jgi:hypothetical protein
VQSKSSKCRGLRLGGFAALAIALLAALFIPPAVAQTATDTALTVTTTDRAGQTLAHADVRVTGENGRPASGAVNIQEGPRILASVALLGDGQATAAFSLPPGAHSLTAVYAGDAAHRASSSPIVQADGAPSATPGFQVTVAPISPSSFPMVLTQGQSGTVEVTVTPVNNTSLSSPMFVTLSCSGLPNETSCTFTPQSVEILADTPTSCSSGSPATSCPPISSMLLQTQAPGTVGQSASASHPASPRGGLLWAILLPGTLGLGSFAFGARRRRRLSRLALLLLLGLVTTLGVSGCSPLYRFYQHGPGNNPPTPTGTYNITVTAQSSNGVTAITNSTTLVLTVQ